MAKDGYVNLPHLLSGRIVLLYIAWSIVVASAFVATVSPHGFWADRPWTGWPWGGSLAFFLVVWLNGLLVSALARLLFARGEETSYVCCRMNLQGEESGSGNSYLGCSMSNKGQPFCNLLERFGVGYFFIDRAGIVRNANDEFAMLRGYKSRREVLGKPVLTIVEPEDVAKTKQHLQRLATGETVSDVFVRHCRDGTVHYHTAMGCPVRRQGEIVGSEGIVIDSTDQMKIENRARRHLAELAQVQRVNSMGKIVSELAHEIAQPLYAITNYAQACSDVVQSGPELQADMLIEWMGQVSEQADRAASVVRRLRCFIHKSKSQRVEVDLNRRIEDVLHLLEAGAREHSVDIEFTAAKSLPSVFADPIQIDQVTVNLIQNAIEAMSDTPPQERKVMIETACDEGDMVCVAVRDMGQGIGEEDLDRIFEAFFSTKNEGMGMGLAICQSIMHEHGGRLWPSHNLDRGTTFHFSLPISQRE